MPIIQYITDNDLYKFTQQQVVLHHFPSSIVEYKFQNRGNEKLGFLAERIRREIERLDHIVATKDELNYMRTLSFMKSDYVDFLRDFRFHSKDYVNVQNIDGDLEIRIKGPWLQTILYEVPVLAIVNQCYFEHLLEHDFGVTEITHTKAETVYGQGLKNLSEKISLVKESQISNDNFCPFIFSNFGTRRRFSREWAFIVDKTLTKESRYNPAIKFIGTSNVYNAMILDVKPIGTMAHEFLQAMQAMGRVIDSQKLALEVWAKEYRGDLGIALSDCLGLELFLKDFDKYFSKLFDGPRHDSGDPDWWAEKVVEHYKSLNINPLHKNAVFSDGLDFPLAIRIWLDWREKINTGFGIGTNLTNDVGYGALKIVLKMVKCNGQDVAKISDSPGKGMCENPEYERYLKSTIEEKLSKKAVE